MPSLQCAAFRAFVTVIPGTWTSTATATRWHSAFVTVVTTLFQAMDTHCHATRCMRGYRINSKKWASSTTTPRAEFRENSFVTKDCCIPGNRHPLPCHAVASYPGPRAERGRGPGDTWQNSRMCSVSIIA